MLSSFFTVRWNVRHEREKERRGENTLLLLKDPLSWHSRWRWYPVCPQGGSCRPGGSASQPSSLHKSEKKRAFFHSFNTRAFQGAVLSSIIEIISHLRKRKVALFQFKWSVIAHWVSHEKWLQWTERDASPRPGPWLHFCVAYSCSVRTAGPFLKGNHDLPVQPEVPGNLLTVPCEFSLEPQHHPQRPPEALESWWWKLAGTWAPTLWGFTLLQGPSGARLRRGAFPNRIMKFSLGFL